MRAKAPTEYTYEVRVMVPGRGAKVSHLTVSVLADSDRACQEEAIRLLKAHGVVMRWEKMAGNSYR
jgi:hypothetical protein